MGVRRAWMQEQEEIIYTVVVNAEEQYSIWPTFKSVPAGWYEVGFKGSKAGCLAHIKEVWKDMRPLSLRKKMEQRKATWEKDKAAILAPRAQEPFKSPTVSFLSSGWHPLSCKSIYSSGKVLKEALDKNHIHVEFTNTMGGTCLSFPIDPQCSSYSDANFASSKGEIYLEGNLILDFIKVRCLAKIDLCLLEGVGTLQLMDG